MNLPEIKEGDFVNAALSGWGVVTKHNDKLIIVYMTISQIEEKLGIKNLKIIKEDKE